MTHSLTPEAQKKRRPDHPIEPLLLNRWSPRAMSGEDMSDEELLPLFEAARWAPSSYNAQPWRFIYAKRNTPNWDPLFSLLAKTNQTWCKNASALVLLVSHNIFSHNQKPSITHSFDTGAAWENLALEGAARGYVIHAMQGFDYEKAKTNCSIPDTFTVEAMIAIGKKGKDKALPKELQEKEFPNQRKPLKELICEGFFDAKKIG